jgi:hypothetical protein
MTVFCLPGTMPDWGEDEEEIIEDKRYNKR